MNKHPKVLQLISRLLKNVFPVSNFRVSRNSTVLDDLNQKLSFGQRCLSVTMPKNASELNFAHEQHNLVAIYRGECHFSSTYLADNILGV